MVSVQRFHEISEATHRIMNPLSLDKLLLLGEIAQLAEGTRHLDLASGKGEMLCQFARRHGIRGVGIDNAPLMVQLARERSHELTVDDKVQFLLGDAGEPPDLGRAFDVVSCIGATWIGGGLRGTLSLMSRLASPGGCLLVGEVFWAAPPSDEVVARNGGPGTFCDLEGTLGVIRDGGFELVEMVLANPDDWDRYAASQWLNVARWLDANPDDPEADDVRRVRDESQRWYLREERRVLGWGVFVLRRADAARPASP